MLLADRLEKMMLEVLDAIIERYDRDPGYPFIDTKLSLPSGRDFGDADPWYTRRGTIYPWIQGRGLEALAGHRAWLADCPLLTPEQRRARRRKLKKMIAEIAGNMERLRRKNHGRLFFLMTPEGTLLRMNERGVAEPVDPVPGAANYSDLFYSKGLMAAAAAIGDDRLARRAERYFRRVVAAILNETFITDQQMFDPKNPVLAVPGKRLQGIKMIALGGTALGMRVGDRDFWERRAIALIRRIFRYHIAAADDAGLRRFDYWEAVDPEGRPWLDRGRLICDPGHTLEFVGLSLKNLPRFRTRAGRRLAAELRPCYAAFLRHQFVNGYAAGPGGIIKAFDLLSRTPVNTDMPWWSLPETIRAAALAIDFTGDESLKTIISTCADAFFGGYVRPACHSMAVQTRDAAGEVVSVIPATPDVDPGYHTNLSLIDALPTIRRLKL